MCCVVSDASNCWVKVVWCVLCDGVLGGVVLGGGVLGDVVCVFSGVV